MNIKNKNTFILIIFFCSVLVFIMGTISYAKYRFEIKAEIAAKYVGVRLSHNGDGQTAIMESINSSNYGYEGYLSFTVENTLNNLISKRDIQYSVRLPNADEISSGKVIYNGEILADVLPNSKYYDLAIVDASGNEITTGSDAYNQLTYMVRDKHEKRNVYLCLDRKLKYGESDVPAFSGELEQITLILDIVWPYKELRVFTVNLSSTLLFVSCKAEKYFDFDDQNVMVKTSNFYYYIDSNNNHIQTAYPIKLIVEFSGAIFDVRRFNLSTENNINEISEDDINNHKIGYCLRKENDVVTGIIINLDMGTYFHLDFYTTADDAIIKCQAFLYVSDDADVVTEYNITNKIPGLMDNGDGYKKIYPIN